MLKKIETIVSLTARYKGTYGWDDPESIEKRRQLTSKTITLYDAVTRKEIAALEGEMEAARLKMENARRKLEPLRRDSAAYRTWVAEKLL